MQEDEIEVMHLSEVFLMVVLVRAKRKRRFQWQKSPFLLVFGAILVRLDEI